MWRATPRLLARLAERREAERAWLACRLARLVEAMATRKDGGPLRHRDIYPECQDH